MGRRVRLIVNKKLYGHFVSIGDKGTVIANTHNASCVAFDTGATIWVEDKHLEPVIDFNLDTVEGYDMIAGNHTVAVCHVDEIGMPDKVVASYPADVQLPHLEKDLVFLEQKEGRWEWT